MMQKEILRIPVGPCFNIITYDKHASVCALTKLFYFSVFL
jgi:hypothetical protein